LRDFSVNVALPSLTVVAPETSNTLQSSCTPGRCGSRSSATSGKQPSVAAPRGVCVVLALKSHWIVDFEPGQLLFMFASGVPPELMHGSKRSPNNRCSWILCVYSKYLITRNAQAHASVVAMHAMRSFFWRSWAARTAHAAVRLEKMRTAVLIAPIFVSRYLCAYA